MKYNIVSVTSFNQNCVLIWCDVTNEAAIVDPGGDVEKICESIDKLKVNVKKILLTHGHVDHVGGAIELKKYYKVPIIGPNRQDKLLLDNLVFQYCLLGINDFKYHVVIPDLWLEENDTVIIGDEIFDVLHCPGHSPGHVVFWNKLRKFIIMGDVLFKENIGRTDLPGGDFITLMNSIKNKLFILDDDILFVPGHGDVSTLGYERTNNRIFQ